MIIWLTGLPASGKTTIAQALALQLQQRGQHVELLDGDEIRNALSPGLGFTKAERDMHIQRIGWLANLLVAHDVVVLVAAISPYREARDAIRQSASAFVEVFVDTSLVVCQIRDTKGTYTKTNVTGVDAPYEPPLQPEVHLYPGRQTVAECVDIILAYLGETKATRYSLFIGRWQPFHAGHKALIQSVLDEGKAVCVAIRDTPFSETDPYTVAERRIMLEAAFPGIKVIVIPDIAEIVYGRKVGYEIRELHLDAVIESISGTELRNGLHG